MGLRHTTTTDGPALERQLLGRLLGLCDEQRTLYEEVLDLSRQQRELVRSGASLSDVRGVLERKKQRLDMIRRLDLTERDSKQRWREGRAGWSANGRTRLHHALADLGRIIEDILACEEETDLELLQQCR